MQRRKRGTRARGPGFAFLSLEAHTAAGSRGVPQQACNATAAAANLYDGEGGGGGVGSGRGRNITTPPAPRCVAAIRSCYISEQRPHAAGTVPGRQAEQLGVMNSRGQLSGPISSPWGPIAGLRPCCRRRSRSHARNRGRGALQLRCHHQSSTSRHRRGVGADMVRWLPGESVQVLCRDRRRGLQVVVEPGAARGRPFCLSGERRWLCLRTPPMLFPSP